MIDVLLAVLLWSFLSFGLWHALRVGYEAWADSLSGVPKDRRDIGPDPARSITPSAGSSFPGRTGRR